MELQVKINMNEKLYVKDPDLSKLGQRILLGSIELIHEIGFENFNFKKAAKHIGTTEAGLYRYFENKHKLLMYITAWYWSWLDYQVQVQTKNISDPNKKLKILIKLLTETVQNDNNFAHINENLLHQIVITEGTKTYLTHHVSEDNKNHLFKPYKDLCASIGDIILECNSEYKYPKSLASTIIEMGHFQNFFMHNLPALTDFDKSKDEEAVICFIESLVFSSLNIKDS